MDPDNRVRLSTLETSLKVLATCFIISILIAYGISILKIFELSQFSVNEAVTYYRGDEAGDSLKLPQSFAGLLSVAHVHSMSQPFLFVILGFIFAFSSRSQKTKSLFFILSFSGMIVSNGSPWLIRYCSADFIYLLPLSQAAIAVGILGMSLISLYDLWIRGR